MADTNIKCTRCKKYKIADDFKKNGKVLKMCIKCRMRKLKNKNKNKCPHNKHKYRCMDCNGNGICIHKKQKSHCKVCGDEIQITIFNMIRHSKEADKKRNHYDIVNFVDKCFLKNLIEDCNDKCYYCKCDLQYMIKQPNLATIERIDNKFGHNKNNVVIACLHCNLSRVGDKLNQ